MSAATPSEPRIAIERAAFGYRGRAVVSEVDLRIEGGDFLGVLGKNGSGKTTLLRGILGLIAPLEGRVRLAGVRFGYVPQREVLDPVFPVTVEEVIQMGAFGRLSGLRTLDREEAELARDSLARVGLAPLERALFASLSGGQRQRVLIARALVMRPNVLVLDEPTSGVDTSAAEGVLELLTRLNREDGLSIVIVSHQLAMTRTVQRVLWVGEGSVRQGDPEKLLAPERLGDYFGVPPGGC